MRRVRPDGGIDADDAVDCADHLGNLVGVFFGTVLRFGLGGVDVGLQTIDALEVVCDGGEGRLV